MTGQPVGVYLGTGFMRCGVSNNADSIVVDGAGTKGVLGAVCGSAPKGALFIGPDGFPVQDPDLRIVQDPNYNWTGSVRSAFRYKRFQVSGLGDIRHGGEIWYCANGARWGYGTHKGTEKL